MSLFIYYFGRFLLGAYFVQAGIRNFMKIPLHTSILEKKGVPMPRESLLAALTVQTAGGLMVALGILPAFGAVLLIAFTIAANYLYHNFTQYTGDERQTHLNSVLSNVAIVGALLMVAAAWF